MSLCKYQNVFGKPGEGAHSVRFLNTAVVDVALTVALAYATTLVDKRWDMWTALVFWLLVGASMHILFCVNTTWTVFLRGGKRFNASGDTEK